jgi:hypothetical protein
MGKYYDVGDKILFKNPRNPTHWATGRVGTIVSIIERDSRPRYDVRCTIEMEDGSTRPIRFPTSYIRPSENYLKVGGHSMVVKKPIKKWVNKGSDLLFSNRHYVSKLSKT